MRGGEYCSCGREDDRNLMVMCSFCKLWYHMRCVRGTRKRKIGPLSRFSGKKPKYGRRKNFVVEMRKMQGD